MVHLGGRRGGKGDRGTGRVDWQAVDVERVRAGSSHEKANLHSPLLFSFIRASSRMFAKSYVPFLMGRTGKERRDGCRKLQARLSGEDFGES